MTIKTVLIGKSTAFEPELYEIKEKYYKEMKHYIGWPLEHKFLDGNLLMDNSGGLIADIYKKT